MFNSEPCPIPVPAHSHHPLTPSPWPTFIVCALAVYLTTLDLSIVNVAFPDILADFEISRADASWIITIYNIFYGSLLVATGKAADQFGRRRMFVAGLTTFAAGSAIAAVAPGLGVLILGRAVQGIGGAMLAPASLGLLLAAFPPEKRTQTIAMWGGIAALGIASGPSIGALVISLTDWRAAFWINLPIIAGMLDRQSPRTRRDTPHQQRTPPRLRWRPPRHRRPRCLRPRHLPVRGLGLGSTPGPSERSSLASCSSRSSFGANDSTQNPCLDLTLFQSRSFSVANTSALVFMGAFAAYSLNNVLFLRQAWGYSVLTAGLLTALPPLTVALLAPFTGRAAARIGFRPFVIAGPIIVTVATLGLRRSPRRRSSPAHLRPHRRGRLHRHCLFHPRQLRRRRRRAPTTSPLDRGRSQQHLPPSRRSARHRPARRVHRLTRNTGRTRLGSRAGLDHDRLADRHHRSDRSRPTRPQAASHRGRSHDIGNTADHSGNDSGNSGVANRGGSCGRAPAKPVSHNADTMSQGLETSSDGNQSAVLTCLADAQRQLDKAKSHLSNAQSERDHLVALAACGGFSHTEIAQRLGVDRSTVSQLLRRNPDLTTSIGTPQRRNSLELVNTPSRQRPS